MNYDNISKHVLTETNHDFQVGYFSLYSLSRDQILKYRGGFVGFFSQELNANWNFSQI